MPCTHGRYLRVTRLLEDVRGAFSFLFRGGVSEETFVTFCLMV